MYGASVFGIVSLQCSPVRVQAFVFWQQGRVDIEQTAFVMRHELRREYAHEAGQYHHIRCPCINLLDHGSIEAFTISKILVGDNGGGDVVVDSASEAVGLGSVGKHAADFSVELAVGHAIQN